MPQCPHRERHLLCHLLSLHSPHTQDTWRWHTGTHLKYALAARNVSASVAPYPIPPRRAPNTTAAGAEVRTAATSPVESSRVQSSRVESSRVESSPVLPQAKHCGQERSPPLVSGGSKLCGGCGGMIPAYYFLLPPPASYSLLPVSCFILLPASCSYLLPLLLLAAASSLLPA